MKQALGSSRANATDKHIAEISLGLLFLMEAAQKTDMVAKKPPHSPHLIQSGCQQGHPQVNGSST